MSIYLTSEATVYDRYSISHKFTAQNTAITMVQGNIDLIVSASDIEVLKNGDKTIYSWLTNVDLGLASINMAVSASVYHDIGGVLTALTQASAEIKMIPGQIELATSASNLVSKINMAPDSIKIDSKNISLTGNGLISILNTGTTTISAGRLALTGNGLIEILNTGTTKIKAENINLTGNGLISIINTGTTSLAAVNALDSKFGNYYPKATIDLQNSNLTASINLKVSQGSISSLISLETGAITIRSNRLTIDSDNFKLTPTSAEIRGSFYSVQKSAWERTIGVKISDGIISCYRNGSSLEAAIDLSANYANARYVTFNARNSGIYLQHNGDNRITIASTVRVMPRLYADGGLTVAGTLVAGGANLAKLGSLASYTGWVCIPTQMWDDGRVYRWQNIYIG